MVHSASFILKRDTVRDVNKLHHGNVCYIQLDRLFALKAVDHSYVLRAEEFIGYSILV